MAEKEKVVVRFNNGKVLKGYLKEFFQESPAILFEEAGKKEFYAISVKELKAIFFVKTFEGKDGYREKKKYGERKQAGKKIFIKFNDGESLIGYLEGNMPWDKGFFLSKPDEKKTGFFIIPADADSNNEKAYIVRSSVKDVIALP